MPVITSPSPSRSRRLMPALAASFLALATPAALHAATIEAGDVTATLGPTFFVDDAALGGTDTDFSHNSTASFLRLFNGQLTPNQGPTRIVLTGFGFATHPDAASNDATSIAVAFTYLGADEAIGGGDDVMIGTATGSFTYTGGLEYIFAFDTPLSADLMITGTRFRIQVTPTNANHTGFPDTVLKLKTGALASEPALNSAKLSVAGVAAPLINPQRLNLAKFQTVTATSTSGQRRASYLTDGVTGNDNRWQGSGSQWQAAQIDFPFPVEVGSAQVYTGVDDASAVSTFYIQYFNGSTWVSIPGGTVSGNTNVERNLIFTNPVTASSFRILGQDANLRIRELALYPPNGPAGYPLGTDLTVNVAYQRPADASANTAGNFALNAVDGRANSFMWQTNTAGTNTLDIDLRVSTKIGSAHLYSGSTGVSPLGNFTLKYWNGTAWQNITGGNVTGNTTADLVIPFTPVTTTMVRLEFTNPGTTSIRELCIFPANAGNVGYPLGTNMISSGPIADYETYNDAFYLINNTSANRKISVPSDGQPKLDPTGLTFGQSQYQILLNLSTGTYRLRNRASGNCLSGAQLDKTPGLPLTDAPYSALPHQDWILDPLGGGEFRLINQWSSLAIDTQGGATDAGTPLVQNTASNSATQRWEFSYHTWNTKKGIGGTSFAMATDPKWAYNWGRTYTPPIPETTSYYPMQWGNYNWDIGSNGGPIRQEYPAWRTRADGIHLLGFNEPDKFDQSGKSLDTEWTDPEGSDFSITRSANEAVRLWPQLQTMDLPLVSPSPANTTNGWFSTFFTQADNLGYRVDYTAVHTYPSPSGGSSDNLVSFVQTAYNNWDRPVWLTEFSFVDWYGTGTWTEEDNYNCLAEFLWRAESFTALRKYALFVFTEDINWPAPTNPWSTVGPRSNSYDINGNLTAFGKLYAAWDNDANIRTNKNYHVHNKDTRKRLANPTSGTLGGRSIRVDDSSVNWTLASAPTSGRYYLVSSRDGRRLSSAAGAAPTLAAAGTTGVNVEWTLTHSQHGWYYIGHPSSGKRLQLTYGSSNSDSTASYSLVANTTTTEAVQWRFIVPAPSPVWSGTATNSWTDSNSWHLTNPPVTGGLVTFNDKSTANLTTTLDQNFSLSGLLFQNPSGPVSIGGIHNLTLGSSGIDLSAATQNLTITAPTILSAAQTWNVAAGRNLSVNGGVTGAFALNISGASTTSLGGALDPLSPLTIASGSTLKTTASSVLANGATAVNPTLNGTLDLYGTSQSINFLTGSGVVDNTAVGAASLTIGNNDTGGTLSALIQNTGGPLTLIKTGSASLTLPIANTHSGGLTNNGTGHIIPQHNNAFGSGPVTMNGATLYASAANFTFTNSLALNAATLRVGGSNSRTLTWDGPVTATGASGISADGGTTGVTINGNLDIAGATFTSSANGNLNNINGPISGAGGNLLATGNNGVLQLTAANTYGGTTTIADGSFLRLTATGTLPPSSNITNNGGLTIRNTTGWVHNGTITGDASSSISLNTGTNATLTGNISGITTINVDNAGTDTTISGAIGSATNINIQGTVDGNGLGAILRLGGNNTYSGTTTITRGKLILAATNVLPDTTAVSIGNATLDAATFSDTAGTLDVTNILATIQLGTGAALAFANSSAVSWSGGALRINGTFVSGASIRFGTTAAGLTSTQLGLITVNGGSGPFILNSSGFLIVPVTDPYDIWKTQITNGLTERTQDADFDGFTNIQEFLFGTSPIAGNGSLVSATASGNNLVLRWLQRETAATYALKQSLTLAAGSWTNVASPTPAADPDQSGTPADYDRYTVTLPTSGGAWFFRIEGVEN